MNSDARRIPGRRRLRGLVATGLALATIAVAAPSALAWSSRNFQSPTGNIRCRYDPYNAVMACATGNDGLFAAVPLYGRAYSGRGGTFPGGPVLPYGSSYFVNHNFRCNSKFTGMTCSSVQSGHGFFTSRDTWRAW